MKPIIMCRSGMLLASTALKAQNTCTVRGLPGSHKNAFFPFCNSPSDVGPNNYQGTAVDATLTSDRFGHPESTHFFNGSDSYVKVDEQLFNISWSSYTISTWYKTDTRGRLQQTLNTIPYNGVALGLNYPASAPLVRE